MKQADIERLFPEVFRRTLRSGSPLSALILVMEALHAPVEDKLQDHAEYFDPYGAPPQFVLMLSRFLDLDRFFPNAAPVNDMTISESQIPIAGIGHLREWIRATPEIARWRGTARGLKLVLEIATGLKPFEVNDAGSDRVGRHRPFHIVVMAPSGAVRQAGFIETVIEQEKSAFVTYEVSYTTTSVLQRTDESPK